ncbi:protein KINASE OF THE OUTER CHLOROPLAST MEMBRANE 1 [Aristolochia californica]|uniref:protein KINASE OF THE OUTER CHLOROPLAST MEMBRANE 1 n=1 Tax=Aristolochia californica TaxID=171875 RepID=UPI0035DE9FEF
MAGQIGASPSMEAFDYEILGEDVDQVKNVVPPHNIRPWIDPAVLKLSHRIGRGPFGDVWMATHHQSTADYDEHHEVAVKMLHPLKEDQMQTFLRKFEDVFFKCRDLRGVCFLHGISIINEKICIVIKFYEGSLGDKMTHSKGGRLSLSDILRYGVDLAQGIMELHSREILILNLKPFNFLFDEHDQAIIGDFGIPSLLLGMSLQKSDTILRVGTPNYMAPEQWEPHIGGPISYETDSWGFGCGNLEMLTGVRPWCGKSPEEIYRLVVKQQERPKIPMGLPPPVENAVAGCFEYDLRNRPLMVDIFHAFTSSQNAVYGDNGWIRLGSGEKINQNAGNHAYTEWFLSKDLLQVGDSVRSRKSPNSCKLENMYIPQGIVVGLDTDGFVLARVPGIHDPLRVHSSTLERVTSGFATGDWIRVKTADKKVSPVGIIHSIDREGRVSAGVVGLETLWKGSCSELQMAESFFVGQFVRLRGTVVNPRFLWPRKKGGEWATGRVSQVLPNGCLIVKFPGRLAFGEDDTFLADPAEVVLVSFSTCPGWVKKYQHLEDFHWAVRPLVIALGLFTALKLGMFIGKNVRRSKPKQQPRPRRRKSITASVQGEDQGQDGHNVGNPAWLPSSVANIFTPR